MEEHQGLLQIVHRLVKDEGFRHRFLTMPKETLVTELGLSNENYDALKAVVPVLIAGGLIILADVVPLDSAPSSPSNWGGWGR